MKKMVSVRQMKSENREAVQCPSGDKLLLLENVPRSRTRYKTAPPVDYIESDDDQKAIFLYGSRPVIFR